VSHASDLYQELILDHGRKPRNFRVLTGATARADGHNPLCGDKVTIYVRVADGRVAEVTFTGAGCAISQASTSLMTEALRGKTLGEVEALFQRFHALLTGTPADEAETEALGKLAAFAGVAEFPMRVKCATLAWHTVRAALAQGQGAAAPVTTE
jgi:nitrogen fixation NifU-like protein